MNKKHVEMFWEEGRIYKVILFIRRRRMRRLLKGRPDLGERKVGDYLSKKQKLSDKTGTNLKKRRRVEERERLQ